MGVRANALMASLLHWCCPQARRHVVAALLSKHEHSLSEEDMWWVARSALRASGLV